VAASPYAKPGPYVTKLPPDQEAKFQGWVKQNNVPWQDTPTADYDMRGYYKALNSGDPNAKQQLSGFDGKMHFPDTYKTPYHRTFSNESQYALPNAPHWEDDRLVSSTGKLVADETPKKGSPVADSQDPFASIAKPIQGGGADPFASIASDQAAPAQPKTAGQKLLGENPVGDTLSNVGTHLKNMVAGPYHAFTDAPQNAAEQRIKGLPGNSGIMGQVDLGAARMFAEPTAKALVETGRQAHAGNLGLGAKDTTYDEQGNYHPTAMSSAMDAVPVAGPWARGVETEAHQKGALPALAGLGTDIAAPIAGGKILGKGIAATGYGMKAASSTPESLQLAGTRAVTKGSPGQLLQSALKPASSYGAGVSDTLEKALPDVIKANPEPGVAGFAKAADTAAGARGEAYQNLLAPHKNVPVDTSPLVSSQVNSIPLIAKTENPGIVGATEKVANRYVPKPETSETTTSPLVDQFGGPIQSTRVTPAEPPRTLGFADRIRVDSNQKLHSLYNKTQGDRYAAMASPDTARTYALNNDIRGLTYKTLADASGTPEDEIRANQDQHGRLIETGDIANKREPVFARHDPVTLSQKIAVGHGGPIATAFNYGKEKLLNNLTNSDALVNSAIDRYKNPEATPLQPREGILPRSFSNIGQVGRNVGGAIDNTSRRFPLIRREDQQ
jgi:hypothetical protein